MSTKIIKPTNYYTFNLVELSENEKLEMSVADSCILCGIPVMVLEANGRVVCNECSVALGSGKYVLIPRTYIN